jgi:hypothetical protein
MASELIYYELAERSGHGNHPLHEPMRSLSGVKLEICNTTPFHCITSPDGLSMAGPNALKGLSCVFSGLRKPALECLTSLIILAVRAGGNTLL